METFLLQLFIVKEGRTTTVFEKTKECDESEFQKLALFEPVKGFECMVAERYTMIKRVGKKKERKKFEVIRLRPPIDPRKGLYKDCLLKAKWIPVTPPPSRR